MGGGRVVEVKLRRSRSGRHSDAPCATAFVTQTVMQAHAIQRKRLADASVLRPQAQTWTFEERTIHLKLGLPPHGVAASTVVLAEKAADRETLP